MTIDGFQTGTEGKPNGPDRVIKTLRWIPIAGYVLAQVLVCVVWSRRVSEIGIVAGDAPGEVLGSFIVVAVPAMVPALFLGVLDGIAWAGRQSSFTFARTLVAPTLLLLCVFWILPLGWLALSTEDFYGREVDPPSMNQHLAVLAGMELAVIVELSFAILIRCVWRRLQRGIQSASG